jgi:hypothetical protein
MAQPLVACLYRFEINIRNFWRQAHGQSLWAFNGFMSKLLAAVVLVGPQQAKTQAVVVAVLLRLKLLGRLI